ncbi:putative bifunctional diguanylate cyclase/phosphodiesterase [Azorhizobium doebereinerae]|uniref:putative bifunctional diguanylate cyclase/phosphodiesterase n=1 Tax=Azorhizobium doebereinerae TaxID=281091 RepID=UPI0003F94999|nr:EAL domain-containing protein [Azorhizobium doebereinerae]
MKCPPPIANEPERLRALADYGLDGSQPLDSLDPIVKIAARMCNMPAAAVNMIGDDRVFFAASEGIGEVDMRRDVSFCAHAITQGETMVVPDATMDERFHDNPLVTGDAHLRFYAGATLRSPAGLALGALCVIDTVPHAGFSEEQRRSLEELAQIVSEKLELRRLEVARQSGQPQFEAIAAHSPTPIVCFDDRQRITAWNDAACLLFGYSAAEAVGRPLDLLFPEGHSERYRATVARMVAAEAPVSGAEQLVCRRKNATQFPAELAASRWRDKGRVLFGVIFQDLTERRRQERELDRLASFDILTGLANRGRFHHAVEEALAAGRAAAVLMIDLDGFKDINDTLGHVVGDGILREVGRRLAAAAGPGASVARIGGDEFAILQRDPSEPEAVRRAADRMLAAIARPMDIDGQEVRVGASCGIAVGRAQPPAVQNLVADADLALFQAKQRGCGCVVVFVPGLRTEAAARRLYGAELHRAVERLELRLHYQPQIRLGDGTLAGAEALIRWQHPERGLLPPAAFLPALEGGPLAATVGRWVLDEACRQAAIWRRSCGPGFRMGVNLCEAQFRAGDLAAVVAETLERHGLPPEALELEITENIVLDHDDAVLEPLLRLRALGVGIAFDDFGTGYASLSLLKRYPLSRIKIDRSFVTGTSDSPKDASVVRAILDLARSFGLGAIAEGIETEAQYRALRQMGCEEGQGYLFSKPLPPALFDVQGSPSALPLHH